MVKEAPLLHGICMRHNPPLAYLMEAPESALPTRVSNITRGCGAAAVWLQIPAPQIIRSADEQRAFPHFSQAAPGSRAGVV